MQRIDDADAAQALKLLLQDHRRIRRLLARAQHGSRDVRARAADRACRELEAHAAIEERLLYPLLGDVDAARAGHDAARRCVALLDTLDPDSEDFAAALVDLVQVVDEHVRHEEETLLPLVRGDVDLEPLADALLVRQRSGASTDVDVDADRSAEGESASPTPAQQERSPQRRGAH